MKFTYLLRMKWRAKEVELSRGVRTFTHVAVHLEIVDRTHLPQGSRVKVIDKFFEPHLAAHLVTSIRAMARAEGSALQESGDYFTSAAPPHSPYRS